MSERLTTPDIYANPDDVITALAYQRESAEDRGNHDQEALLTTAMLEASDRDKVAVLQPGKEIDITATLVYLALPKQLQVIGQDEGWQEKWHDLETNWLGEIAHTKIKTKENLEGKVNRLVSQAQNCEQFKQHLDQAEEGLELGGRLVALVKPEWILQSWPQLDQYHLQLEYPTYKAEPTGQEEVPIALVKKTANEFDQARQKQALEQFLDDHNVGFAQAEDLGVQMPYREKRTDQKASLDLEEKYGQEQYFFTAETTAHLVSLFKGETACLCLPSVHIYGKDQNRGSWLFDMDNRFRTKTDQYVKYDLTTGLNPQTIKRFEHAFDTVIVDPPFTMVTADTLATDVKQLLKEEADTAYVIYPAKYEGKLKDAFSRQGFNIEEVENFSVDYANPPQLVKKQGAEAIRLYKCVR